MKELEFTDIVKMVDAMINHECRIITNDNVFDDSPTLGFISEDEVRFFITMENFKESLNDYAPNNRKVVLFSNAMKSENGKKVFYEYVNSMKNIMEEPIEQKTIEPIIPEQLEPVMEVKEEISIMSDIMDDKIESILDDCVKDLLTTMSLADKTVIEKWKTESLHAKLLYDIINGEGPKGVWLKVILEHLESK